MTPTTPLLVVLVSFVGSSACNPNDVGRACVNPNADKPMGTQISAPALECSSRLCLIQEATTSVVSDGCPGGRCTCTAECSSNDDCAAQTLEFCSSGFVCAVAADVGPFCCKKLCICRDDLAPTFNVASAQDKQIITPTACDPSVPANVASCSNLRN